MILRTVRLATAVAVSTLVGLAVLSCKKDSTGPGARYVGGWEGVTSQGKALRFYVEDDGVPLISVSFQVVGTSCTDDVTYYLVREPPDIAYAVTNNALTATSTSTVFPLTVSGAFTSGTEASGTLTVTSTRCNGSINETWTAAKAGGSAVSLTGTWTGTYQTSLVPQTGITLTVNQSGSTLNGTYSSANGGAGTLSGTVSGKVGTFTLTSSQLQCPGHFDGHAALHESPEFLYFAYGGSDCLGTHTRASGLVSR